MSDEDDSPAGLILLGLFLLLLWKVMSAVVNAADKSK